MPVPAARYAKCPRLIPTPRHQADASVHHTIDVTLRAARQCAQQVSPLESYLQDEMRILERIYYKGVNQHRMAPFWKRTKEVRRLGKRVLEVQLLALLDDFRYSFYIGEDSDRNPKVLRGAWTQVPDAKFLNFIHERVTGLLELVATAKERFSKAFHCLSLTMQTGAFLQLILTLTAIVSRLNAIMEELSSILPSFLNTLRTLLEALGHRKIRKKAPESTVEHQAVRKSPHRAEHDDIALDEMFGEDLGATVVRKAASEDAVDTASTEPTTPFWQQDYRAMSVDQEVPAEPTSVLITTSAVVATNEDNDALKTTGTVQARQGADARETTKVKKKKTKPKDAIDEIFGLL